MHCVVVADDAHAHIFLLFFFFFFFFLSQHQIGMLIISLRFFRDLLCFSRRSGGGARETREELGLSRDRAQLNDLMRFTRAGFLFF